MNQVTINGDALRDVMKALLGEQGAEVINQAYLVVDAAEKRGHEAGFKAGYEQQIDHNYDMAYNDGYDIGYAHGNDDGRDQAQAYPLDPATINDLPSDCEFPYEAEAVLYADESYEPFAARAANA